MPLTLTIPEPPITTPQREQLRADIDAAIANGELQDTADVRLALQAIWSYVKEVADDT